MFLASEIIKNVKKSCSKEFIIETEKEIVKNLKRKFSNKKRCPASEKAFCYNLEKITF